MADLFFEKLVISNFKSYSGVHEFQLDRPPGLYYVTGQNVAEPELGANDVGKSTLWDALTWAIDGSTLRTSRPGTLVEPWDGGKPSVWLTVKRDGKRSEIMRSRKPNKLQVHRRGQTLDVEDHEIEKILGLSPGVFRRTVIIGQFDDLFLDIRPEQQSQLFVETLDLNLWLEAAERASALRQTCENNVADRETELTRVQARIEETADNLAREKSLSANFENECAEQIKAAKAERKEKRFELKNLPPPPDSKNAVKPGDALKQAEENLDSLRDARDACRHDVDEYNAWVTRLEVDLRKAKTELELYEGDPKKCPECGQTVSKNHIATKRAHWRKEVGEIEAELKKVKRKREAEKRRLDAYDEEIKKDKGRVEFLQSEAYTLSEQANLTGKRRIELEIRLEALDKELDRLETVKDPHKKTIKELEERLEALRGDQAVFKKELSASLELVDSYKMWGSAFKEIRLSLIDEVLRELEAATNKYADALGIRGGEIQFATERESKSGNTSAQFNVTIYPPGSAAPRPWEAYAGGVSQRWQMAATFGLSEVLLNRAGINPNIEILDEPTQHMSKEGIDDLLVCLRQRALDLRRAIYLVDHRVLPTGSFDGVILIERDDGGSRIVVGS